MITKQDKYGKPYNAVYIHFAEWYQTPAAAHFQERVLNPNKEALIVYDDPWYWIVLENKGKRHEPGARKECLDLSVEDDELKENQYLKKMTAELSDLIEILEEKNLNLEEELFQTKLKLEDTQCELGRIAQELEEAQLNM